MHARALWALTALVAASNAVAADRDLTVVMRGEALRAPLTEVYFAPFAAATDIAVRPESWEGGIDLLRPPTRTPETGWDMVQVDAGELSIGCSEGLFEKLDWSAVGGRDHYMPAGAGDCGVGAIVLAVTLAWDRDKFPATPTWADFWDVAKYPGKRGLRAGVRGTLEIALLADGVAPADVYKTLATSDGVDRAFRKLDQLKPYLVWWQTEADAVRILGLGEVLMTSAPSSRVVMANRADKRNFGLQWTGGLLDVQSWVVVKGSPFARQAQQLLYFMGTTPIQARFLRTTGESGLAKGINEGLPPEVLANSSTNPANMSVSLRTDAGFWNENQVKLRQRFEAWQGR